MKKTNSPGSSSLEKENHLVARALWFQYDMNSIGSCFLNICLPAGLEGCGTFKLEELEDRGQPPRGRLWEVTLSL